VGKGDESINLQMTPTKESRSLHNPPRESTTSRSMKFPPGTSSPHWGQLKWRLTTETTRRTPQNVSNIRRHTAGQVGRLPLY
jgi:hypothetical protein